MLAGECSSSSYILIIISYIRANSTLVPNRQICLLLPRAPSKDKFGLKLGSEEAEGFHYLICAAYLSTTFPQQTKINIV